MAAIAGGEYQADRFISADPGNGIIAVLDSTGAAVNIVSYGTGSGDVTYSAPAGNTTNTRTHRFDRPIVSTSSLDVGGAATLKATGSVFRSNRVAGVSCPNATATTVLDLTTGGFLTTNGDCALVVANDGNDNRVSIAFVTRASGTPNWRITSIDNGNWAGGNGVFSMSGNNLQFTQTTGGTVSVNFTFFKIAGN